MSFLDTDSGQKIFNQYLKKVNGSSQRVYRSEIQQFFDFKNCEISNISKETLHSYQERLSHEHSSKTAKRKFSILNGFFKFLEKKVKGFQNPIDTLTEFKTHTGIKSEDFTRYLGGFLAIQNTTNTRKSYENLIKLFFTWVNKDLCDISKIDLLAYRDYLRGQNYRDTTIWNKLYPSIDSLSTLNGKIGSSGILSFLRNCPLSFQRRIRVTIPSFLYRRHSGYWASRTGRRRSGGVIMQSS